MNTKFKMNEKTLTTLLYVGAAILVVAILAVSIFAFSSRKKGNEVVETPGTTQKDSPTTSSQAPVTSGTPVTTAAPVTTDRVNNINTPKPSTAVYKNPIEGVLAKGYDADALVYSVTMNDYRAHLGLDLAAPVGTPVYAIADGTVLAVYNDYLMGTCIEIEHGNGIVSCYKNLQEALPNGIVEGAKVNAGQLLAGVGESAIIEQSDEAHFHFEVKKNGENVDPLDYVSYGKNTESLEK